MIKSELKHITPEWAAEKLKKNTINRPISSSHLKKLMEAMELGHWQVNGDAIRFAGEQLLDGQHRLTAVVKTGVEIDAFVITGLPREVFKTIDTNKPRSAADTLWCIGEKNVRRLAAALILVDRYTTHRLGERKGYSNTQAEELLHEYPDIRLTIKSVGGRCLLPVSVMDTCYYLFWLEDTELADEFWEAIITGANLEKGSPWHRLRQRAEMNYMSHSKLPREKLIAFCIKAWNAAIRGKKKMGRLRMRDTEKCPRVLGYGE